MINNNTRERGKTMENELLKAYSEVDKILTYMEEKYVEKIPKKLRELFKNEKLKEYEPVIDPKIPLDEQNLQRKTYSILAMLNLNYWVESEEEKQELIKIYAENDKKREEELREKYNPDNIFKKQENREKFEETQESKSLIEYKEESFIKKIVHKIMRFFRKK